MNTPLYLAFYDDTPKRAQTEKIRAAAERYQARFGAEPNVALVNPNEIVSIPGLVVRASGYVGKNTVQVGRE